MISALLTVHASAASFATPVDFSPDQLNQLWERFMDSDATNSETYFPHSGCFKSAAVENDVPETLLLAMARGESNFDSGAVSKANAIGVMQIQWPGTAEHLGITDKSALYDPCTNIEAGSRYIREMLDRYDGNIYLALAAYNYGPGRISRGSAPDEIPDGAHWYSEYVYDHLQYVLSTSVADYAEVRQVLLISFSRPYRAKEFVAYMQNKAPGLRFDWFKRSLTKFDVVFNYDNPAQKLRGAELLEPLGFEVE